MRDLARVTRALAATVLLALLLLGVPIFLAVGVGWPLPRSIPAWGDVTATLAGDLPLDSLAVLKTLSCVMWVAWAQVVVATVIEAGALNRGRVATPLRGFGHMQQFAGPLLSAVALLLPSGVSLGGVDAAVQRTSDARPLAAASGEPRPATGAPPNLGPVQSDEQPAPAVMLEHIVVRRDTLWDLAERYMSPGGSIEQISTAVQQLYDLNAGRAQPAGDTLTDASLIRPGWVLQIPPVGTAPNGAVAVQSGDTLWDLAEDHLGDGHRYVELLDLNVGQPQPDGAALTDPSLIEPGWILRLPGEGASAAPAPAQASSTADPAPPAVDPPAEALEPLPAPTSPPASAPPGPNVSDAVTTAPHETGPDATEVVPTEDAESGPSSDAADRVGPLGVAGGILGLGLMVAAGTRRRRSRMRRQPGSELPALPPEAAALVGDLGEEELDLAAATSAALRQLTSAVASLEQVPVPILATVNGDQLELLLDRDEPSAPPGWIAGAGGRIWRLDLNSVSPESEVGPNGLPALASIGRVDDGGLLLNLEALGSVGLVGDAAATTGLASSLAIELAVSPLADVQEVHLVGDAFAASLPSEMLGISRHASVVEAMEASKDCGATIGAALAEMGLDSPFALRSRAPEEAWPVAIVIADAGSEDVDDDSLDRLVATCRERPGLVAIIVGACPVGATAVTVADGQAHIEDLDLHCQLQQLDPFTVASVESLLAGASAPAEAVDPAAEPLPLTLFQADEPAVEDPEAETEHEIAPLRLQLLGPLSFEGDVGPQHLALLTYLVLHPGATADAIRDAIWGGQAPTRERFLNTIHELRRVVGSERMPASTDSRYRLQGIACDALVAQRHIEAASAAPECATAELRAALELVNGPPLTYDSRSRRHFRWVDAGNHANRWERILGDAAHDLASLALAADDASLAVWAAEQGLLASPGNETLTSDLVFAHVAAGDRRAAETVVDSYEQTQEELGLDEGAEALHDILEPRRAS